MRFAVLALLAAVLFAPPPADAQLGRLLDRARNAAENAADTRARDAQRAAAASAQSTAEATVPTGPLRPGPSGYVPGVDLLRLLTDFRRPEIPRGVGVVFPGAEGTAYTIEVRDAAGTVVQQFGTDIIEPMPGVAYTVARTNRRVGDSPEAPGRYVYTVRADGAVIAELPYSITVTESGDPMRPDAAVSLDGPWRTHAALRFGTNGRPELRVRLWVRNDEMGGGVGAFTVTLERDGRAVSEPYDRTARTPGAWLMQNDFALSTPDGLSTVDRDDLADGDYRLVLRSGGREVKAYAFRMEGGEAVPHTRSALAFAPRANWLAPYTGDAADAVFWATVE